MLRMNAWVLDLGMGYSAAVGERELLHLIDVPATFSVPYTPHYCHKVVSWQGRLLPVMDIASRLGADAQEAPFIAVVGYQQQRGAQPQFGGILLTMPPRQIMVGDEQACALPEHLQSMKALAISCFDYQGDALPVLNLNQLFNLTPRTESQNRKITS